MVVFFLITTETETEMTNAFNLSTFSADIFWSSGEKQSIRIARFQTDRGNAVGGLEAQVGFLTCPLSLWATVSAPWLVSTP